MALREPSGGIPADRKWIMKVKEEGPPQMGQHLIWWGGGLSRRMEEGGERFLRGRPETGGT